MGGAAVGGYLLTALPSWTRAPRVAPQTVRALTLSWVLARLALPLSAIMPVGLLRAIALGYFVALCLTLARHLIAAKVWKRLWVVGAVGGMALGDAGLLANMREGNDASAGPLVVVLMFAFLISMIGGRAVPAFTRSWLQGMAPMRVVRDNRGFAAASPVAILAGGGLVLAGQATAAGFFLLLAGSLLGLRSLVWQGLHVWHSPALLMLHLAWLWLPAGLILVGTALLHPQDLPMASAVHAVTMGAMGTMILAIAGRAAMVRHGDRLMAGPDLLLAFALVWSAALQRVLAPFVPSYWPDPVATSAALWMLGWSIFLWAYRRALQGALPFPIFSARRHGPAA